MTAQGNPRTAFRRAIERGNVVVAEIEPREVGRLDLLEALEVTALIAARDRPRSNRYRAGWLQRCLEEKQLTIEDVALVASSLNALGGRHHDKALTLLRAVAAS